MVVLCWFLAVLAIPVAAVLLFFIGGPVYRTVTGYWPWEYDAADRFMSILAGIVTMAVLALLGAAVVDIKNVICHFLGR